jgi:hypothetical protein
VDVKSESTRRVCRDSGGAWAGSDSRGVRAARQSGAAADNKAVSNDAITRYAAKVRTS